MKEQNGVDILKPVTFRLELDWYNNRGVVRHSSTDAQIDYKNSRPMTLINIPRVGNAKYLRVRVYIENALMCCVDFPLETAEVIK